MDLQKLNKKLISQIRSQFIINSLSQCILELIFNSIDANAKAIAIRINLIKYTIQVIDNGEGITKENMKALGVRYMTNKCFNPKQLENYSKFYGFRGEALASIVNISKNISICSKSNFENETYNVILTSSEENVITKVKNRPSSGTTVTIEGVLHNIPIRQKRIIEEVEIENIKKIIESLVLIHPNISFSFRNDTTGHLILNCKKSSNIMSAFIQLFPEITNSFTMLKVTKNKITVEGLIHKELIETSIYQFLYVNKRPISCTKLQNLVCGLFKKFTKNGTDTNTKKKCPIFVINIKSPNSEVDILLTSSKTMVNFKCLDLVSRCVEKLIYAFFEKEMQLKYLQKDIKPPLGYDNHSGMSQVAGAVKACACKRKRTESFHNSEVIDNVQNQNVINENCVSGKTKVEKCGNDSEFQNNKSIKNVIKRPTYEKNTISGILKNPNHAKKSDSNYNIEDSQTQILTLKPFQFKSTFKKPLPVIKTMEKKKPQNQCEKWPFDANHILNENLITKESSGLCHPMLPIEEQSLMSNLSTLNVDEDKGKKLIMNMFLKSTQAYDDDDIDFLSQESNESIKESNFYLENTIKDNVRGYNTTMSISVNVKRTKMKKKQKLNNNFDQNKLKSNPQILLQEKKMVSKYVQTSVNLNDTANLESSIIAEVKNKNAENYTIVLDNLGVLEQSPNFKFIYKKSSRSPQNTSNPMFNEYVKTSKCKCQCENSKIFTFNKAPMNHNEPNINFDNQSISPITTSSISHLDNNASNVLKKVNNRRGIIQKTSTPNVKIFGGHVNPKESPYFQKQNYLKNRSFDSFTINWNCNQQGIKDLRNSSLVSQPRCHDHLQSELPVNEYDLQPINGNDLYNVSFPILQLSPSFENFKPIYWSTQLNKSDISHTNRDIHLIENNYFPFNKQSAPYNSTVDIPINDVRLNISGHDMNNRELKNTYGKENKTYVENYEYQNFVEQTFKIDEPQKFDLKTNIIFENEQQDADVDRQIEKQYHLTREKNWEKVDHTNFNKSFYINKHTGMTRFLPPTLNELNFSLRKRVNFVPKGLSPILKEQEQIDKSLSQVTKNKLQDMILEIYQNELLLVKWENYIKKDPKTFFEEVYKDKTKIYEEELPKLNIEKAAQNLIRFNKDTFSELEIIGQVDRKFIAVYEANNHLILLFDQHAVHERIRLENLLKAYKSTKSTSANNLMFFIPQNDIQLIKKHLNYISFVGLQVDFFHNGLNVISIPLCLQNRYSPSMDPDLLIKAVQSLINEILEILRSTSNAFALPKILQDAISSEACRGAIKFGNHLSRTKCKGLLADLALCSLPFQCAHGRPSVTPIVTLNRNIKTVERIHWKNLYY